MGTASPATRASVAGPSAALAGLAVRVASVAHVCEHSGKSRLAQHPARGRAAVYRGTRPSRVRGAAGVPRRANGRRRASRVSNARDAGRAGPAVCHAHCARRILGCLGGHARVLARTATALGGGMHVCRHRSAAAQADLPSARPTPLQTFCEECPTWATLLSTPCAAPRAREAGPGDWPHGWQFHASRTRSLYFRERVLLP